MNEESKVARKGGGPITTAVKYGKKPKNAFAFCGSLEGLAPAALTISLFLPFYFSVIASVAVAVMTMLDYRRRTRAFEPPYTRFLLCSMIGSFFVAAVYNNYWGMLYSILLMAVIICGLYLRSIMTRQIFHRLMDWACACSVCSALVAFWQKYSVYASAPDYRPVSTFTNANYYGTVIEFVVLIAAYRIMTSPRGRALYLAVIGLNLSALYLCASMSSCFALVCGLTVLLLLKKRYRLLAALLLTVTAFAVSSLLFPAIFPRVEAIDHTFGQRLSIWTAALRGITESPLFGRGAAAYRLLCGEFNAYATFHCHNLLLDTLLNFGFVGTAAIGAYLVAQARLLALRFRHNIYPDMNVLVAAIFAAVCVHGITDVTIFWVQTGLLFMLVCSSTGISAACLESRLRIPGLLKEYARAEMHVLRPAAYFKNS